MEQFSIEEVQELIDNKTVVTFLAVMIRYYLAKNQLEDFWRYLKTK